MLSGTVNGKDQSFPTQRVYLSLILSLIIRISWATRQPMVVKMCVFHIVFLFFLQRFKKITGTATTVVSSTGTSNPRTFSSCQAILTHQRSWLTSVPCCNRSLRRPWGPWGPYEPYGCSWGYYIEESPWTILITPITLDVTPVTMLVACYSLL